MQLSYLLYSQKVYSRFLKQNLGGTSGMLHAYRLFVKPIIIIAVGVIIRSSCGPMICHDYTMTS